MRHHEYVICRMSNVYTLGQQLSSLCDHLNMFICSVAVWGLKAYKALDTRSYNRLCLVLFLIR